MTIKNENEPGVDVLFGMVQAFFIWILRNSKDDNYIAKCFRDVLNHFLLYEVSPEYLGAFMITAIEEKQITVADLKKLESILKRADEKQENVETVSFLIEQAEQYLANRN